MKMIDLIEEPIAGLSLEEWIGLYDAPIRANYGLEYLTAAKTGTAGFKAIVIPDAERYTLPDDLEESFLDDKIELVVRARYKGCSASEIGKRLG